MLKILFVLPSITQTNGICSFVFNYISHLDKNNFKISVLATDLRPSKYYINLAQKLNVKLILTRNPGEVGFKKWYRELRNFFKKNHYFDIIYSNVANQSMFIFHLAKKYGIKKRIIHSHSTSSADIFTHKIRNNILNRIMLRYVTNCFACSIAAGKALYGKREFVVINNAIDYSKFVFNSEYRHLVRKSHSIKNEDIVVGFVGRFVPQKNLKFFVDLANNTSHNIKFLMIGNGPMKKDLLYEVASLGLDERFIFVEECNCVEKYYSAMDIFALPSFFEGLPVSGIEAQISGLTCIFSKTITDEAKIIDKTYFLSIDNVKEWTDKIESFNDYSRDVVINEKYDISIQAKLFEEKLKSI